MQRFTTKTCLFILVSSLFLTQSWADGTSLTVTLAFQRNMQHREVLRIGRGTATSVAWSPDGSTIAVGGSMGVRLYTPAFRDIAYFESNAEPVEYIQWSPDGTKLLTSGGFESSFAQIRDVRTGDVLQKFDYPDGVAAVTWSPDNTKIAVTDMFNYQVDIWDVLTGLRLKTFNDAKDRLTTLTWSPDGKELAAAGYGSPIYIWDISTGLLLNTLEKYENIVTSVAWSPDGKDLVSTGLFGGKYTAILWSMADFRILMTLTSFEARTATWNSASTELVSISSDGKPYIWNAVTGKIDLNLEGSSIDWITWSPDDKRLVGLDDNNTLITWDTATGRMIVRSADHSSIPAVISWRPLSQQLAVSYSEETSVDLLSSDTGKQIAQLYPSSETPEGVSVTGMAWSPDGKILVATFDDYTTYAWSVSGNTASTPILLEQGNNTTSISWNPDSIEVLIVSGIDQERQVSIWNAITGYRIAKLQNNSNGIVENGIGEAAWSPNGDIIATSTFGTSVQLWNATTFMPIQGIEKADTPLSLNLSNITWSPDNTYLVGAECGTEGNKVCSFFTWNIAQKHLSAPFEHETGWTSNLTISPNGKYIATDDARLVYIWDTHTGQLVDTVQGHIGQIISIAWSPDSHRLATTSRDGSIRIWEFQL